VRIIGSREKNEKDVLAAKLSPFQERGVPGIRSEVRGADGGQRQEEDEGFRCDYGDYGRDGAAPLLAVAAESGIGTFENSLGDICQGSERVKKKDVVVGAQHVGAVALRRP
jgi:hypothetical protein